MRPWYKRAIITGIGVLAVLGMVFCSGCLKGSGNQDPGNHTDVVVTNANDTATTNSVTDEAGGEDVETNATVDVGEEEDAPKVYVALGDSVTTGTEISGPSWPAILGGMLGVDVINAAHGGDNTRTVASKVPGILAHYGPDYILVVSGTIDAMGQWPIETFYPYFEDIVSQTLRAGATPVLATFPPEMESDRNIQRSMQLNAEIRRIAARHRIPLVDLEAAFNFRTSLYLSDLFHPNNAGTALMAREFYDALR